MKEDENKAGSCGGEVEVYLRNSQKKARLVKVERETTGETVRRVAAERMKVP